MSNGRLQIPTENEDFQAALGQVETLINIRKNLVYGDGPVADLDAIISDHLQDLLDEEQSDLEIDLVRALSTLSWIQHKMIDQHFETFEVDQLMNWMIQQMREARDIQIAAPLLHEWSVPVLQFATLGYIVTTEAPHCYLRLAFSLSDTRRFEIHDQYSNYYEDDKIFGFYSFQITKMSWTERSHRVMLGCQQGEVRGRSIFIDMMHERDVMKFLDMLLSDGLGQRIQCIPSEAMSTKYANFS
ncbi:MAG: hypothetical protein Q9184_007558 [Pyrenodesmia sp. 2 TL-2023]